MMEAPPGRGGGRPPHLDEPEILARSRRGDVAAFAVLVNRYRDRAYGLALRVTRSATDAEEVAQDAFVSAWGSLDRFREDARFSTWLYRIVWRKSLDRSESIRRRGRREVAVEDPGRLEAEGTAGPGSPGPPGLAPGDAARLERHLGALPELSRAVVTLYYYEDRSVSDVAAALGIPEGTVKTHLHRSRAAIRERWLLEEAEGTVERDP
jgi:RNA polymerase sigma-70 factor (ECF subfamily)